MTLDDPTSVATEPPPTRSDVNLHPIRPWTDRGLSSEALATAPGPTITAVVGLACVALSLSVIWRGDASETVAGFWPPAGAALVALVVLPTRRWGWAFAGIVVPMIVGLAFGLMPVSAGLLWGLGNCVEPALAALVLRRFAASKWFTSGRLRWLFVVAAVVGAPMIGGAIGVAGTMLGYGDRFLDLWPEWVLGDGLGVLVVAPFFLSYSSGRVIRRSRRELVAVCVLVTVATALAFADIDRNSAALLPYLILVTLIWAGMRFGTRLVAAAGFVVALGANLATSLGVGPFAAAEISADIITLQIFLAIALITSFIVASMAGDLADRDEVRRLLTHQATHDDLTGLPNRTLLAERLQAALSDRSATSTVTIQMIDLDDFKKINDRHGHPAGDGALCAAADLLRTSLRPGDLLARIGGDEFVVLSQGLDGPEAARAAATNLADGVAQGIDVGGHQYQLGGSIGVAMVDGTDPITASDLLHRADVALYHAKRTPGLGVALFDDAIEATTRRRVELAEELREAIDRAEMSVVYQPVVSLTSGRVTEFEALVRWHNRRFGSVGPDEFIGVAEDTGFVGRLGDWVLHVACTQLAAWRAGSPDLDTRVAVNASARQLCDVAFPGRVRSILVATSLPASALTLEITETAVMDDLDASERVMADLRAMGVELSMDDFGTGYSSLSNLRRTPLHVLKIDRTFVAGLGDTAEDSAIVESIINLGHSFGLAVVAEGIETTTQLLHLIRLGCDFGQGYLWSPGVDQRTAGDLLRSRFSLPAVADAAPTGVTAPALLSPT